MRVMDRRILKKNAVIISAISQTADLGMMALHVLDRERKVPSSVRTAVNVIGVAGVNASWIIAPLTRQPRLREPLSGAARLLGAAFMLGGAAVGGVSTWNRRIIGIETPDGLVREGMYRYMRHPTYVAILCGSLGWSFYMRAPYAAAALPPLALQMLAGALYEERMQLKPLFGEEYEAYRSVTPFFPTSLAAAFAALYLLSLFCAGERFIER